MSFLVMVLLMAEVREPQHFGQFHYEKVSLRKLQLMEGCQGAGSGGGPQCQS